MLSRLIFLEDLLCRGHMARVPYLGSFHLSLSAYMLYSMDVLLKYSIFLFFEKFEILVAKNLCFLLIEVRFCYLKRKGSK